MDTANVYFDGQLSLPSSEFEPKAARLFGQAEALREKDSIILRELPNCCPCVCVWLLQHPKCRFQNGFEGQQLVAQAQAISTQPVVKRIMTLGCEGLRIMLGAPIAMARMSRVALHWAESFNGISLQW